MRLGALLLLCLLGSCSSPPVPRVEAGVADLRSWDWSRGSVALAGTWSFGSGVREVPDTWKGDDAGGPDGRGFGTYALRLELPDDRDLALRYTTAATALTIEANGNELVRVGNPDPEASRAVSAYAPGTVKLPRGHVDLKITVSNHDYRVGGLWTAPSVGPAAEVEAGQWAEEVRAVAIAAALAVIGFAAVLLFLVRRKERAFLFLGLFALLVALRALVTGEYPLVRMLPGLGFETLIRLEYLTAFLPIPAATEFFLVLYPGVVGRWGRRALEVPPLLYAVAAVILPLDLLTRSIVGFYPLVLPALLWGLSRLVVRAVRDGHDPLFLPGVIVLAAAALGDVGLAAFFSTTGNLVPWGLAFFVVLESITLGRRLLSAFEANEALLAEKEFLVREVHHRVKNSLQVVASLVTLQGNRVRDPALKDVFAVLRRRVTAVALVHEKLHGQGLSDRPDLAEYLRDLLALQLSGDNLGGNVQWSIDLPAVEVGVDFCVDAGLILTELVGNAYKHAVLPQGGGLSVSARARDGRLVLEVTDDGPGFPEGFRPEAGTGLGFRLITALLQRNAGTLTFQPGPGGKVRVELKLGASPEAPTAASAPAGDRPQA